MGASQSMTTEGGDHMVLEKFRTDIDPNLFMKLSYLSSQEPHVDEVGHELEAFDDGDASFEAGIKYANQEMEQRFEEFYAASASRLARIEVDAEEESLRELQTRIANIQSIQTTPAFKSLPCEEERQSIKSCFKDSSDILKCAAEVSSFSQCAQQSKP